MLRWAKDLLAQYGATFLISGEVIGQRPMSQRLDALNVISRESDTRDILLRPLCAKRLPESAPERSGLVQRENLLSITGRGRRDQLALAKHYALSEIPTPAGGCLLTEQASARRFFPLFTEIEAPKPTDFDLANVGRQYWAGKRWLAIGRNQADNARLEQLAGPDDLVFKVRYLPGPLGLARRHPGSDWNAGAIADAAAFVASFNPKAVGTVGDVQVDVAGFPEAPVKVTPARQTPLGWREPTWEEVRAKKRERFTICGAGSDVR